MLVVLTAPEKITNEITILHSLFEMGLETLHLRKPSFTIAETRELIQQIAVQYHSRLVLHQHHKLYDEFQLKGIHLKEVHREELGENVAQYIQQFITKGATVSTSYHKYDTLKKSKLSFTYYFLSPVFTSISKKGYIGKEINVTSSTKNIIALGGITATNIHKALRLGYKGIAILGTIWNSESPIKNFKHIQQQLSI